MKPKSIQVSARVTKLHLIVCVLVEIVGMNTNFPSMSQSLIVEYSF